MLLLKAVIVLGALGLLGHRLALALAVHRARMAGDPRRAEELRRHGFRLYRWGIVAAVVVVAFSAFLTWSVSR